MKSLVDYENRPCNTDNEKLQALVGRNFFIKDQVPLKMGAERGMEGGVEAEVGGEVGMEGGVEAEEGDVCGHTVEELEIRV